MIHAAITLIASKAPDTHISPSPPSPPPPCLLNTTLTSGLVAETGEQESTDG